MDQMNVFVVSSPGRRRENLLSMLESIDHLGSIRTAETCNEVLSIDNKKDPVTVLIDYRHPEKKLEKEISTLIMSDAIEHIVLLQSPNSPKSHFTHYSTSELVYDDLSIRILSHLFRNIQLRAEL